jgi:hypothetical protein
MITEVSWHSANFVIQHAPATCAQLYEGPAQWADSAYNFIGPHLFQSVFGMPLFMYDYTIPPWMVRDSEKPLRSNDQVLRSLPQTHDSLVILPSISIPETRSEIKRRHSDRFHD